MPALNQIIKVINHLAPWNLAEPWDQVGLQAGNLNQECLKVLVSLDFDHQVLEEGLVKGVNGFIVHHPLIFKPLNSITDNTLTGRYLATIFKKDLFLIAVHTNIDKAEYGLNYFLGKQLKLTKMEPIEPVASYYCKVVVFVPEAFVEQVRNAMSGAGAGVIGDYYECSFELSGTGTFKPGQNTQAYIGAPGVFERTPEIRLEMVAPKELINDITREIRQNHPYEEPAIDIIPLLNYSKHGLGKIGVLSEPITLEEICRLIKSMLPAKDLRVLGDLTRPIHKVAICTGSGRDLLTKAINLKADLFLTGELGYHDYLTALDHGIAVITAGHRATENCFIQLMTSYLNSSFDTETNFKVFASQSHEEPYLIL